MLTSCSLHAHTECQPTDAPNPPPTLPSILFLCPRAVHSHSVQFWTCLSLSSLFSAHFLWYIFSQHETLDVICLLSGLASHATSPALKVGANKSTNREQTNPKEDRKAMIRDLCWNKSTFLGSHGRSCSNDGRSSSAVSKAHTWSPQSAGIGLRTALALIVEGGAVPAPCRLGGAGCLHNLLQRKLARARLARSRGEGDGGACAGRGRIR